MFSKKAITNVVALLLVIFMTFAIAGSMYYWFTKIQVETQEVGTQYQEKTLSNVITELTIVDDAVYNTLAESDNCIPTSISMLIQNTGAKSLDVNNSDLLLSKADGETICLSNFAEWCNNLENRLYVSRQNGASNADLIYSTDGTNWVVADSNLGVNNIISSVVFDDNLFYGSYLIPPGDPVVRGAAILKTCDNENWNADVSIPFARNIYDLVAFNGSVYAATGSDGGLGAVYKREANYTWTNVYASGSTDVRALLVFNDQIYAGISNTGKLVRSEDGEVWSLATSSLGNVTALATFNDIIYAGLDDGTVWASSDGTDFGSRQVLNTDDDEITAMANFSGKLFVGTKQTNAASIYKYDGSGWWERYRAEISSKNDSVHDFISFKDKIYAVLYNDIGTGGAIIRSDTGDVWSTVYSEVNGSGFTTLATDNVCANEDVTCVRGCNSNMVPGETRTLELQLSNTDCDISGLATGTEYGFRINFGSSAAVSGRFSKEVVETSNANSLCEYTYPFCNGACAGGGSCVTIFGAECVCMAPMPCEGVPPDFSCSIGTGCPGTCELNAVLGMCECV